MLGKLNLQQISNASGLLEKQPRRKEEDSVSFNSCFSWKLLSPQTQRRQLTFIILINHFLRLLLMLQTFPTIPGAIDAILTNLLM